MKTIQFEIVYFLLLFVISNIYATTPSSDTLLQIHHAGTTEMNNLNNVEQGSLIYNTSDETLYEHNLTAWHRVKNDGSETKIITGTCTEVIGNGTKSTPYTVSRYLPGKTKLQAGLSCKSLLNTGCASVDGTYWINPDGGSTSNAFEVFCDMHTEGGGWARIEYAEDLSHQMQFGNVGDGNRWLNSNFTLALTNMQINDIRATSTEGKQHYHGTCQGVIHHRYQSSNYNYAFGFRFHNGNETVHNQQTYPNTNITVLYDGCYLNNSTLRSTDFDIIDIRVPVINVHSRDNGNNNERFGSPLTKNPAWLR